MNWILSPTSVRWKNCPGDNSLPWETVSVTNSATKTIRPIYCTVRHRGMGTQPMGTILRPHWVMSSQKNRNSLTWVLVALTVCFTYPVLYRVSSESRAGEWELWVIDNEKSELARWRAQEDHSILSNSSQPAGNRIWASRAWTQFLCRK